MIQSIFFSQPFPLFHHQLSHFLLLRLTTVILKKVRAFASHKEFEEKNNKSQQFPNLSLYFNQNEQFRCIAERSRLDGPMGKKKKLTNINICFITAVFYVNNVELSRSCGRLASAGASVLVRVQVSATVCVRVYIYILRCVNINECCLAWLLCAVY